jgi:demethylmenaquinone methyltransferase/2-methoxy-6-polyprenyl-1,4-benzoquinol methylase/phosphoethanolamine N-methyltransferase
MTAHPRRTPVTNDRHAQETGGKAVRWAHLYDLGTTLLCGGRIEAVHRAMVARAGIGAGERVLDVGCGPGRLAILAAIAAGPAGEVWGIDPAPEMVALARRKAGRAGVAARFEVGVIETLRFSDAHFDVVLSSLVLHHLPDELKRRGLTEIHRVLRSGGRLVAADFRATPGSGIGHLLCVLGLRSGSEHADRLRDMLREAGFEAVETEPVGHRALALVTGRRPAPAESRPGA